MSRFASTPCCRSMTASMPELAHIEWSRRNVSLMPAVALAWPAKPLHVAKPATRRMLARTPPVLGVCIREKHADGSRCNAAASTR